MYYDPWTPFILVTSLTSLIVYLSQRFIIFLACFNVFSLQFLHINPNIIDDFYVNLQLTTTALENIPGSLYIFSLILSFLQGFFSPENSLIFIGAISFCLFTSFLNLRKTSHLFFLVSILFCPIFFVYFVSLSRFSLACSLFISLYLLIVNTARLRDLTISWLLFIPVILIHTLSAPLLILPAFTKFFPSLNLMRFRLRLTSIKASIILNVLGLLVFFSSIFLIYTALSGFLSDYSFSTLSYFFDYFNDQGSLPVSYSIYIIPLMLIFLLAILRRDLLRELVLNQSPHAYNRATYQLLLSQALSLQFAIILFSFVSIWITVGWRYFLTAIPLTINLSKDREIFLFSSFLIFYGVYLNFMYFL